MRVVNKYRNTPTMFEGRRFASVKEARRYGELLLRERAGEIRNLECQVRYPLMVNGYPIAVYVADFAYEEATFKGAKFGDDMPSMSMTWEKVVEDVKGLKTAIYRLKAKLMRACHGVIIRET